MKLIKTLHSAHRVYLQSPAICFLKDKRLAFVGVQCVSREARNYFFIGLLFRRNSVFRALMRLQFTQWSRDSAVGIATGYGLDDGGAGVGVPVG
jgi:hypothetical protein